MGSRQSQCWILLAALALLLVLAAVFRESLGLVVFLALAAALLVQLLRVAVGKARPASAKQLARALRDAFWGIS